MREKVRKYSFLLFIPAIILFGRCSPKAGNSLLNFFFDGVPENDTAQMAQREGAGEQVDTAFVVSAAELKSASEQLVHIPYLERECGVCHDEKSLGSMVQPEPDLCYQCHEDYSDTYNFVHGPVAGGYCTACHNPHQSEEESLLRLSGQELCLNCHDSEAVFQNEMHMDLGETSCMECHNPHGGDDRFIFY